MDPTIKDFESAISELETIVKRLEDGDLALEKSLELFERGVQLSRFCHSKLEEAERRVRPRWAPKPATSIVPGDDGARGSRRMVGVAPPGGGPGAGEIPAVAGHEA